MTSKGQQVVFHLMKDVNSKKPERYFELMIFGNEHWEAVLASLKFNLCTNSTFFLFDIETGRPVKFDPHHLQDVYYITERAYLSPEGTPSKYAYIYKDIGKDIKVGDIVLLTGKKEQEEFRVLAGKGGNCSNPQLDVQPVSTSNSSSLKIPVSASNLIFLRRSEEEDDSVWKVSGDSSQASLISKTSLASQSIDYH